MLMAMETKQTKRKAGRWMWMTSLSLIICQSSFSPVRAQSFTFVEYNVENLFDYLDDEDKDDASDDDP